MLRLLAAAAVTAVATWFFPSQPAVDDGAGAADSGFDLQGFHGAVFGASPAFHTAVFVLDANPFPFHDEDGMGADLGAYGAADAFFFF